MNRFIVELGNSINKSLVHMPVEEAELLLYRNHKLPAVVAFYAASAILGREILEYEIETIQIALVNARVSPYNIERVVAAKTLISDMDGVFSVPQYFNVAVDTFCDDEIEPEIVDFIEPAKIIWTLVVLAGIYGADNIPLTGDALRYVVACLKEDGWTMPPYMLDSAKFHDFFEYYDEELYESIKCTEDDLMIVCGTSTSADPKDAKVNFMERHKPILQYIHAKTTELKKVLKTKRVDR